MDANNLNYQLIQDYDSTYWSSLRGYAFLGGVYLSELVQFQYQLLEHTSAYSQYHSYRIFRFGTGVRMVQGQFGINYVSDSYIYDVIRKVNSDKSPNPPAKRAESITNNKPASTGRSAVFNRIKQGEIQRSDKASVTPQSGFIKEGPKTVGYANKGGRVTVADQYESFRTDNIDLEVRFGVVGNNNVVLKSGYNGEFDTELYSPSSESTIGTGFRLIGFQITGKQFSGGDQGMPIIEVYSFVAKDVVPIRNIKSIQAYSTVPNKKFLGE